MIDATQAAYALVLGAVAAFNPCGFALLPAYLTVIVTGSADAEVTRSVAVRRALRFSLAMTLGFMAVFTVFGILFGAVNVGLQGAILPYVPFVTIAIGVVLVALGIVLLVRGELSGPGLRMSTSAPSQGFRSQVVYGAGFAVASLSCTIGLFLAAVLPALTSPTPVGAVVPILIYGLGMGASIAVVSVAAALAGSSVARGLRRHTVTIMRIGGGLMVVAGLYVVVYGLAEVLQHFGITALNPVLTTTGRWQGAISQTVSSIGTPVLIALVVLAVAGIAWMLWADRRDARARAHGADADAGSAGTVPPEAEALPSSSADGDGATMASPAVAVADADTLAAVRDATRR